MSDVLELRLATDEGGNQELRCPAVGVVRFLPASGELLGAGEDCGQLHALGRAYSLRVPPGATGRVIARSGGAQGYDDLLLRLEPIDASAGPGSATSTAGPEAELVYRSPMAGRFYRRPAPDADPYVAEGEALQAGKAIGLLEVMKTFSPLRYEPTSSAPEAVRLVRFLAADGDEVEAGQPLLELEPGT